MRELAGKVEVLVAVSTLERLLAGSGEVLAAEAAETSPIHPLEVSSSRSLAGHGTKLQCNMTVPGSIHTSPSPVHCNPTPWSAAARKSPPLDTKYWSQTTTDLRRGCGAEEDEAAASALSKHICLVLELATTPVGDRGSTKSSRGAVKVPGQQARHCSDPLAEPAPALQRTQHQSHS